MIEADQSTVSLALHPRLTVVSGLDGRTRAGLAQELIGGLGSHRSGVHLELRDDADRHLAVFRPTSGAHRVLEVEGGTDVSEEFRAADGRVDLLGRHGVDAARATELLHLDHDKLAAAATRDEIVNRLAEINQTDLWSCAARVRITDDELRSLSEGLGAADGDDDDVVARIEARHQSLEVAVAQHQLLRRNTAMVAAVALIASAIVGFVDPMMALPLVVIGLATVALAFVFRARLEAARRAELAALADAGADSYLGFVVQRVDGMFTGTEQRRRLTAVADDHRAAAVRWTRLAGDVSVDWAMTHYDDIQATARMRRQLRSLGQRTAGSAELDEVTADTAHALVTHLARLRHLGETGESFPLVLDEPFTDIPRATKLALLELLSREGGCPQVVVLTDDEDVAGWARVEALTGEVALVEPHQEQAHVARAAELAG